MIKKKPKDQQTPKKDKGKKSSKFKKHLSLADSLMEYLVDFGPKKGIKRSRIRIGEVEAEIEFPSSNEAQPIITTSYHNSSNDESHTTHHNTPASPSNREVDSIDEIEKNPKYKIVRSPLVGTFYRSPSPGGKPFVEIGDRVQKGQPVAIIEAMKLYNEVESEHSGLVVKILTENETPVEYNQALFVLSV